MKAVTSRHALVLLPVTAGLVLWFGACGRTIATPPQPQTPPPEKVVESFEDAGSWAPIQAQGVRFALGAVEGKTGKALQFDFSFPSPSGYVVAGKDLHLALPDDYKFTFFVKGNAPENTLEFKLIDKAGNTFWKRFENFSFPHEWTKIVVRKSQIAFAWGPAGGGTISEVARIELAVSCGTGGSGKVAVDELTLVDLSAARTKFAMTATASSCEDASVDAPKAVDGDKATRWASQHKDGEWIELDLGAPRDFVGMTIQWEAAYAKEYDVLVSNDRQDWTRVYTTTNGDGGIDDLYFGRRTARYVRIDAKKRGTEWGNSIYEIAMKGPEEEIALSASSEKSPASAALDGDMQTAWRSSGGGEQWLLADLGRDRDVGGLFIHWDDAFAKSYDVYLSSDNEHWTKAYSTRRGNGGRDRLVFHESEARYIKIDCLDGADAYGVRELEIKGPEAAGDQNKTYEIMAEEAPRGHFPKYFSQEATYWTLVGVTEDVSEALVNEEGAIEVDREQFSIEPFLFLGAPDAGKFVTWGDVKTAQYLEKGYLPVPEVTWTGGGIDLAEKVFADGEPGASTILARYTLSNPSTAKQSGSLFLAVRPFQVNPPWQKLNQAGGVAKVRSIAYDDGVVRVNDDQRIFPVSKPDRFGAAPYAAGDITEFLRRGAVPPDRAIADNDGYGSGAFEYRFDLAPGETAAFVLAVAFHKTSPAVATDQSNDAAAKLFGDRLAAQNAWWIDRLDRVVFHVPEAGRKFVETLKSNIAYIFLNRDGYRMQPGSRSYLRSWIRDGALTSAALLRMNNPKEVREYLSWYAKFLFPDGRVPCVVDDRGPDGVPENDSNGEFIYGFLQYFRFTGERAFLQEYFEQIRKAADFIIAERNSRKTDEFKNGPDEKRVGFGLVPESISHEGYSAKPAYSLWDDFLCLKGLKDAGTICEILGKPDLARKYRAEADDFRSCILASIALSQKIHHMDHIPGAVDLGDFDPTATSIALFPCGELDHLPQPALDNTFNQYYADFEKRLVPGADWGEAYTPYEIRNAQSFIIMGKKDRAQKLFAFFFHDQRPANWNHWSEIVFRDPKPGRWLGDMPHTWIGSDFIKAVRSMFLYERDADQSLVVNAGVPQEWLSESESVGIEKAPTYWGIFNYAMKKEGDGVRAKLWGDAHVPGSIVFRSPLDRPIKSVKLNGKPCSAFTPTDVMVKALPAELVIGY